MADALRDVAGGDVTTRRGQRPALAAVLATCAGLALATAPGGGVAARAADETSPARDSTAVAANFELRELADGVYAVLRIDPAGLMVDANSLLIVNDDDVVVVDAPVSTPAVIAALRTLTDKPVSAVINTHWHDDHITGNAAYRAAWPDVEFIGHARMLEYLPGQGAKNRASMIEGAPGGVADLRSCLESGTSIAGVPLTDEERASYRSDIALVEQYLAVVPGSAVVLPTTPVTDRLVLTRGARTIEVFLPGAGHTAADLAVYLPNERILAAGDLVIHPVPLVGRDQSHVTTWGPALDRLAALDARLIVPGHGPVLTDTSYLALMARTFRTVSEGVTAALARGVPPDSLRREVPLTDLRNAYAGDSALRGVLFDVYVAGPSIGAVLRELQPAPADSAAPR
jgi:cyclase